jgi:hypothetical protein
MDMNNLAENIVTSVANEVCEELSKLAKSTWAAVVGSRASMARNKEEQQAFAELQEKYDWKAKQVGTKFLLESFNKEELLLEQLLEDGKSNPLTGGVDGIVTHLDGTQTKSQVPKSLQGYETNYGWEAQPLHEDTEKILQTSSPVAVEDIISNSSSVEKVIKEAVIENLHLGGGS